MYLNSHQCQGKAAFTLNDPFFGWCANDFLFSLAYMCNRESDTDFSSRAAVRKGYELLLLAAWEMLLVPRITKPKLAYLFFLIKTHFWCFFSGGCINYSLCSKLF